MFRRHAPIEPRLDGGLSGSHTGTVDSHVDCVQLPDQPTEWRPRIPAKRRRLWIGHLALSGPRLLPEHASALPSN